MDNCTLADNPDWQYCCSTSDAGSGAAVPNWWRVDFDQYYTIDEGVITGRSGNTCSTSCFTVDLVVLCIADILFSSFSLSGHKFVILAHLSQRLLCK